MSVTDDRTILHQAKALEGMRERLRSHMTKLTERQRKIDSMATYITACEEKILHLQKVLTATQGKLA